MIYTVMHPVLNHRTNSAWYTMVPSNICRSLGSWSLQIARYFFLAYYSGGFYKETNSIYILVLQKKLRNIRLNIYIYREREIYQYMYIYIYLDFLDIQIFCRYTKIYVYLLIYMKNYIDIHRYLLIWQLIIAWKGFSRTLFQATPKKKKSSC